MSLHNRLRMFAWASVFFCGSVAVGALNTPESGLTNADPHVFVQEQIEVVSVQTANLDAISRVIPAELVDPTFAYPGAHIVIDKNALETASLDVEAGFAATMEKYLTPYKEYVRDIELSRNYLSSLPKPIGDDEFQCLAEAIYFEARGETLRGQRAVAEVILNQVASTRYPNTICGVVNQGTGKIHQCQFSYTCDGHPEQIHEWGSYDRAKRIARLMIDGLSGFPIANGALFYHTTAVSPSWASQKKRVAQLGVHLFYR